MDDLTVCKMRRVLHRSIYNSSVGDIRTTYLLEVPQLKIMELELLVQFDTLPDKLIFP